MKLALCAAVLLVSSVAFARTAPVRLAVEELPPAPRRVLDREAGGRPLEEPRRISLGTADVYEAWFCEGPYAREVRVAEDGTIVGRATHVDPRCF